MEQQFPGRYYLNGSDYFQVFINTHHRRYSQVGNVCRLVLSMDDKPDISAIEERLNEIPFVQWLASLRLRTSIWFQLPYWTSNKLRDVRITQHSGTYEHVYDCAELVNRDIRLKRDCPISFDLVSLNKGWAFVFSWNHVVMDARGAELLMQHICHQTKVEFIQQLKGIDRSWGERLKEIKKVKNFLVPSVRDGIQLLYRKKRRSPVRYRTITFSESETLRIDRVAIETNAGLIKSMFYLAAVQLAFQTISENPENPIWTPIPQDQRKKGQLGPIMSNQVSFMFYSMPAEVRTVSDAVTSLKDQMMDQMRRSLPRSYWIMMDSMRRFPSLLYNYLVASPTKGALASYFFSDTGNSLNELSSIGGVAIRDAIHYPPNSAYPGLTIIFMRRLGRQRIIYSFPEDSVLMRRMDRFEQELRSHLLQS